MGEAARVLSFSYDSKNESKTTRQRVENTFSEEIVIGLCAPIGTNRQKVIDALIFRLENDYKYECEIIKLSDFIVEYSKKEPDALTGKTRQYSEHLFKIDEGDSLRNTYSKSFLAELAIQKILLQRYELVKQQKGNDSHVEPEDCSGRRKCFIIDSIKNKEELMLFRSVYRELFYFISVFSPLSERKEFLKNRNLAKEEIEELISIDSGGKVNYGQEVVNTFKLGDFFLRISSDPSSENLQERVNRYLHLIFDTRIITPTISETAMYKAKSAAGNSACLSRQVGASVTDPNGIILSVGWNDVPKFGGGLYYTNEEDPEGLSDNRCMNKGQNGLCFNDSEKNILSEALVEELVKCGLIEESKKAESYEIVRKSNIKGLIEYSRSVHAEMHAIIVGAQSSGNKMINGKLFCTTYPCHNCARHIIAAGIKEVYYIEPYPKSLCIKLHNDDITENESETNKVRILMFDGVAPNRYLRFFTMNDNRKSNDGSGKKNKDLALAKPKTQLSLQAIPTLEAQAIHSLKSYGIPEYEKVE